VAAEVPASDDFADRAQAIKEAIAREETVVVPAPVAPAPAADEPALSETVVAQAPVPPREEMPAPRVEEPVVEVDEPAAREADESPAREADADAGAPGRVVVGEDDLLADVDTGVNEDEFKW